MNDERCFNAQCDLERVICIVRSWDAGDARYLARELNELHETLLEVKGHGSIRLSELKEELELALSDRGTQTDQDWPSPWNEWACDFAYVVDKKGQYLTRKFWEANTGQWFAGRWEAGVDCNFPGHVDDGGQKA